MEATACEAIEPAQARRTKGQSEISELTLGSRNGAWRVSHIEIVRNALTNVWLEDQGLHSLETQWVNARYPQESTKPT